MTMNVKIGLRNSTVLPTLTYGTWTWNKADSSRIQASEKSYLRRADVVSRWDAISNAGVYRRCGISERGKDMGCGATEWVKQMVWSYGEDT